MANWAGRMHKRMLDIKSKAVTLMWYKRMFYKIGSRSTITPPLFGYQPEWIEIGDGVSIGPFCRIEAHPAPARNMVPRPILRIGDRVRIGHGVNISCHKGLVIESDCLIAGGSYISDNTHSIDPEGLPYNKQPLQGSETVICRGAWIGQNVCVLSGSYIGERSIIGAGSVVNAYIPPYSIAVGSPAKVVKQYDFDTKEWRRVSRSEALTKMINGV